ncbi:MAG TPA: Rrf2 family transcriptional regulator [Longimicrobium sp.]|nr:Rrf2 family transcriptional regulator [Longimicrobium sp.]
MISSRVAVAVHVLAYMAWKRSEAQTSERIASSVNTNPVVVRRIMGALRNAGMVTVQPGVGGGATLARDPAGISLLDVYRAVEDGDELFSLHPSEPSRNCNVGGHIRDVLRPIFCRAHRAMEGVLAEVSIADVGQQVMEQARSAGGCCADTVSEVVEGLARERARA